MTKRLVLSERTIKYHMRQLLARLPQKTRSQVVDYARRTGLAGKSPAFAKKYGPKLYFSREDKCTAFLLDDGARLLSYSTLKVVRTRDDAPRLNV